MILEWLKIDRLPGIDEPFELELSDSGIHIIFGPNAIGKSSICRAVKRLYWDDLGISENTFVSGRFQLGGKTWQAERKGSSLNWSSDSELRLPPGIPASHHHRSFFLHLRDLIDSSLDGTRDIASEIKRQMSGGYDLRCVCEESFPEVSKAKRRLQRREFNDAEIMVQEAERSQQDLQRQADELNTLRARLDEAKRNARRLPLVSKAIELVKLKEEQDSVLEKIAALPKALANLSGEEPDQIRKIQERIDNLEKSIRNFKNKRDAARVAKEESRLSDVLDKASLNVWRQNAEELVQIDLQIQIAKTSFSECQAELKSALSDLGRGNVDQVNFTLENRSQLFSFLQDADKHRQQKIAIEERLRLLEDIGIGVDEGGRLEDLRAAINLLRRWLRAPAVELTQDRLRGRGGWILLAATMAIVGAGMAVLIDPVFGLLLTAAIGIMVPVLFMRGAKSDSSELESVEKSYAKLDAASLEKWDDSSVEAQLRSLEECAISIESRQRRARDRAVERKTLENQLTEIIEKEPQLEERRVRLLEHLGLESMLPDAELVDMARSLGRYQEALSKHDCAAGQVADLERRFEKNFSDLSEILQNHHEPKPENAKFAREYLSSLTDRSNQLAKAMSDESEASSQLEVLSSSRNQEIESMMQIYKKASLENGDLIGLTNLLRFLPEFCELKKKATVLEGRIPLSRDELANAGETELSESDMTTLERLQQNLSNAEMEASRLHEDIAEIDVAVRKACDSNDLQERIARREKTRTELQDLSDKTIFAAAGRFLVDLAEHEYEQNQMPRVFERARNHFSEFTRHGYELRLNRDSESPRLCAIDLKNQKSRELDELSDGTRAQLLIAARLAFAEEVEQGTTLPLFLDEALDQSDPERFEAIVSSLVRIAHDQGRQIFYLTSDPLDRIRFSHAIGEDAGFALKEHDLGMIRKQAATASDIEVPPKETIPAPDRASIEEYGIKLSVPAFSPSQGYARQHFLYVLWDNLPLLHKFLLKGVEKAGQWATVSRTALAEQLCSCLNSANEIDSRVGLLEVFCAAWNQGRVRIIDIGVLMESGAVSRNYLDAIASLSRELGNDPEKLILALKARKDPRLRGFRNKSVKKLEEYFYDYEYLDDRPILDESEIKIQALASPQAVGLSEGIAEECLRRWWIWAAKAVDSDS